MTEEGKNTSLKVYIRLRPQAGKDRDGIVSTEPPRIMYLNDHAKGHKSEFLFERVFGGSSSQQELFEEVGQPLVKHVLQGFNACCLAYGQTGSGKTYSMFGGTTGEWDQRGMMPRCTEHLFKLVSDMRSSQGGRVSVFVSFLEIYLEQVRDLGYAAAKSQPSNPMEKEARRVAASGAAPDRNNMEIFDDPSGSTMVRDLTYIEVANADEAMAVLRAGSELRQTAATGQNETSSRSHTVFTLSVVRYRDGQPPITGRLHLVDLAGSERLNKSNSEGARLTETKSINTSLTALGKVVMMLAAQKEASNPVTPRQHVPFRDSKLTRLLKDSLQGNSWTTLLAALNPHPENYDECFATLQFALRCQSISTTPVVNTINPEDLAAERLMQQVAQLQQELELTHHHYQGMLESVASSQAAADAASAQIMEESSTAPGAMADPFSLASGKGSASNVAALEAKLRRLEAQLAASNSKLGSSDARLLSKRSEAEEFRERMMAKDFSQVNEMKRLRDQVNHAKAQLAEAQMHVTQREEEAQRRFDEECSKLTADNEALRAQLAAMSQSVNSMMETRSSSALAAKQQRDALVSEADRRLREQVSTTVADKNRQLDNLRQQSAYYLQKKSDEIATLREQLSKLRISSQEEVGGLMSEIDYLGVFAAKLTELLRKLESGSYAVVERGGMRQYKVPQRDKPAPLQKERLRHLSSAVEDVEQLLAASVASATSPAPSIARSANGGASLAVTSRIQSASIASTGGSGLAAQRRSSSGDGEADGAKARAALESDAEALRAQWEATYREAVANEVASELASDKTVQYIRSLEAQLAKYRQEVQAQKKQTNDMVVALRTVQRAQSPINAVLSGQIPTRPPTWGPGHTLRPNTASATMKASAHAVQAQSGLGSWGTASGSGGGFIHEGLGF